MEDILASIRRIIAEDQSNALGRGSIGGLTRRAALAAAAETPAEAKAPPPAEDALAGEEQQPAFEPQPSFEPETHAGPQADMMDHAFEALAEEGPSTDAGLHQAPEPTYHAEPEPEQSFAMDDAGEAATYALAEPAAAEQDAEPLMSAAAGASITSSFHVLAETMVLQDPELIERVMRDSMRPLLKAWLDDHLPSIVERLVRAEIERVARGGRGRNS